MLGEGSHRGQTEGEGGTGAYLLGEEGPPVSIPSQVLPHYQVLCLFLLRLVILIHFIIYVIAFLRQGLRQPRPVSNELCR